MITLFLFFVSLAWAGPHLNHAAFLHEVQQLATENILVLDGPPEYTYSDIEVTEKGIAPFGLTALEMQEMMIQKNGPPLKAFSEALRGVRIPPFEISYRVATRRASPRIALFHLKVPSHSQAEPPPTWKARNLIRKQSDESLG